MKPHPRIRKAVKWGGAFVTALSVGCWVCSACWITLWMRSSRPSFLLREGELFVAGSTLSPRGQGAMFLCQPESREFKLGSLFRWPIPKWHAERRGEPWCVQVPLSAMTLATFASTFVAWRLDTLARRRAKLNGCPRCGYDRSGLAVSAVCPECGTAEPKDLAAQ